MSDAETDLEPANEPPKHDPYAALRIPGFRRYFAGHVLFILGLQMQSTAIGWQIYEMSNSTLALAVVSLTQVAPVLGLALVAGHVADRQDRKKIVMATLCVIALTSVGLALATSYEADIGWMYVCLFASAVARAFHQPAKSSLLPQIVPRELFPSAVTWAMSGFQLASVVGPALAGVAIAQLHDTAWVYLFTATAALIFFFLLWGASHRATVYTAQEITLGRLGEGFVFLWRNKVVLGAMALDMFAVLLGGATALFPVFARDILEVGPQGFSMMEAAPAVGALLMSFAIAHRPPLERAGRKLLLAVVGFGVCTILFGMSSVYWFSLLMLLLTGVFDNISVVIRHTLVQTLTPDSMRGRVSAINGMFIGASNELGGFESGMVAYWLSPRASVIGGGLGTLLVVASAAVLLPQLRHYGRLGGPREDAAPIIREDEAPPES